MVVLSGLLALVAAGCGNKSADLDPAEAVNIRIRNEMGGEIERLWLGDGPELGSTFQTRFTAIGDGEVSDHLTVEGRVENYQSASFTIDGERFFVSDLDPHTRLGVDELSNGGYYTFVIVPGEGNEAQVSEVVVDRP